MVAVALGNALDIRACHGRSETHDVHESTYKRAHHHFGRVPIVLHLGDFLQLKPTGIIARLTDVIDTTQDIRSDDSKGRHTTTNRNLRAARAGGWLIDTPGMREAQIWFEPAQFSKRYKDLLVPAQYCRFSDCRHDEDPDCAVRETALKTAETAALWRQYSLLQAMAVSE